MNAQALILLIVLNACHWAGDFTHLSTDWMLNAKKYGKPLYPIFMHALVHSVLFFIAVLAFCDLNRAAIAFFIQLPGHFIIDLLKGRLNLFNRELENPGNKFHWWIFGADQFMHHLIILLTVYIVVS